MSPLWRWMVASTVGVSSAALSWCVCAFGFNLDAATSATVAALGTALAGGPLAAWASYDGQRRAVPRPEPAAIAGTRPPARPLRLGAPPALADANQVREVSAVLVEAARSRRTALLVGLGGVGKTQLAARHAAEALERGDVDLVVWADASSRDAIVNAYAGAAAELTGITDTDATFGAARLLRWLAETRWRWLVVLDDIADPGDLRDLWPASSATGYLVGTSRRQDAVLTGHNRMVIHVEVFTATEAVAYLREKLPADVCADAAALAEDLGYLPLALAQAAAYITNRRLDCATYRRRLADGRRRLTDLFPEESAHPDDYRSTVAATWSLSGALADELAPQGLASCLLELLSVMAPSGVPGAVLAEHAALAYLTTYRTAGTGQVPAEDSMDALRCLHRLSLAAIDDVAGTIRVHALLQRVVRERLEGERLGAAARAAAQALVDFWPFPERPRETGTLLRTNAAALLAVDRGGMWEEGAHPLVDRLGRSLGESGDAVGAAEYFRVQAARAVELLGADHRDTIRLLDRAAYWRGEGGDATGALHDFEALQARAARALGDAALETLEARCQVARWRGESGDPTGAVVAYERVLPAYAAARGIDHPETMKVRSWFAYMRGEAGDPVTAVAEFERLVADRTRVLGPDHRDTLAARHLAARWRGVSGGYAAAARATEDLLADYLRVLGPDHPDTLHIRHSLARWWGHAGDPQRAVRAFESLLTDRTRVLGPEHVYTLANRFQIARWRGESGDRGGAVAVLEALVADRERILGPDHHDSLAARSSLAYWRGDIPELPAAVRSRSDY